LRTKKGAALAWPPASNSKSQQQQQDFDNEVSSQRKPRDQNFSPADSRPAPDISGEDDFTYFTSRPNARHRVRWPFPHEFPNELLTHRNGGTAVVMERDTAGRPTSRARAICFIDGGTA
jgi:hypothetical protein